MTKYEWSLNGTVMATTATYEVPASAKDGDEIKLTVTAEDGETASDTVYVGGLTILQVEPMTQGSTYKYVRAYFSSALTSLDPSDIEIRGKKDQRLYSIETARLSSDGMSADLTLYGDADKDDTTFLRANTTYVMTLTTGIGTASLEFELPAWMTDKIVTSVSMSDNTITVASAGRTGEADPFFDDDARATFKVNGKYTANLGSLIGRSVNFQYNTENALVSLTVDPAEVVTGAMKYVNDGGALKDGYYKDALTGETYKNSDSFTSVKNVTKVYNAKTGEFVGNELTHKNDYQYTKLVLNPDGTVSTANVIETLPISLYVTAVDGTEVIQDKNAGLDLDGYTIVKDDEYVAPADLELGDVVFVNSAVKFADVYNNEVSGEISDVIEDKLNIDGQTYTWKNAQYYDPNDDVYKTLSSNTPADSKASQNYLNSLDTETDTTIYLKRNKNIAYVDGTVVGEEITTDHTFLLKEAATPFLESLSRKIKFNVFDGESSTFTVDIADLKYFNGNSGKYGKGATEFKADGTAGDIIFTTDPAVVGGNLASTAVSNVFPVNTLLTVTYNADGEVIGLAGTKAAAATNITKVNKNANAVGAAGSPNIDKDTTSVTAGTNLSVGSFTNLWIRNEKGNGEDLTNDAWTLTTVDKFENGILTNNAGAYGVLQAYKSGSKASDIVVTLTSDAGYAATENDYVSGIMTDVTYKNNADKTAQILNTIKLLLPDGTTATYTGDGKVKKTDVTTTAGAKKHDFVNLTLVKGTDTVKAIAAVDADNDWNSEEEADYAGTITSELSTRFDSEKLVLDSKTTGGKNDYLTVVPGNKIFKKYSEGGSTKYDEITYADANTLNGDLLINYHHTYTGTSDGRTVVQSDMIVITVVPYGDTPELGDVTVTVAGVPTIVTDADGNNFVSTNATSLSAVYNGTKDINSVQWYKNNIAVTGAAAKEPTITKANLGAADGDRVRVKFVASDGTEFYSDTFTFADPVATTYSLEKTTSNALAVDDAISAKDQFGVAFDLKNNPTTATNVTLTKGTTGGDHTAATVTGAGGTATNLEKFTIAGSGGTAFGAGDVVTFKLGTQTVTCTFTGATAYNIAITTASL